LTKSQRETYNHSMHVWLVALLIPLANIHHSTVFESVL